MTPMTDRAIVSILRSLWIAAFLVLLSPATGNDAAGATPGRTALIAWIQAGEFDKAAAALEALQASWERGEASDRELRRAYDSFRTSDAKLAQQLQAWLAAMPDSIPARLAFGTHTQHVTNLLFAIDERSRRLDSVWGTVRTLQRDVHFQVAPVLDRQPTNGVAIAILLENGVIFGQGQVVEEAIFNPYVARGERLGLVLRAWAKNLEPWNTNSIDPWDRPFARLADFVTETERRHGRKAGFDWLAGYLDSVRGERLQREGDLQGALAAFGRAIAAREDPAYYVGRGVTHALMDDPDAAIRDFDRALAIDGAFAEALCQRGLQWRRLGHLAAALRDLDAAVALDPLNPAFLVSRASVLTLLGRNDEARADAEAALVHGKDYVWVQQWVGYLNRDYDPDRSMAAYARATELAQLQGETTATAQP
jgi:tetratricopeptide (TPR) repeat protein